MKTNKLLILGLIMCGLVLSSCGANNKPSEVNKSEEPISESALPSEQPTPSSEIPTPSSEEPIPSSSEGVPDSAYLTVSEAYALALEVGDAGTSEKQYVRGFVKSITNANYGEMYITDGDKDLYIYGVYSADGARKYPELEEKPYKGDEVFLYGIVKTYKDSPEMGASWLQKFVSHQGEEDLSEYTSMNVLAARNAAKDSKILVQGVVASITYANGKVPSGVYLTDDTSSIYVYGPDVAGRVEIGEEIQVAGVRDDYILATETSYAQEWGYQGSIQLADAIFVKSIGKSRDPFKNWIEETTMKKLLETPLSNNITTKIYKVNAIVNKVPGSGFVNYYIDDLDNKTGSYVYTLCNGSDFAHLDKFDDKICTVYVAIHNAKAAKSGTVYRLMPVKVEENTAFSMSDEEIAKFALEYYAAKQFRAEYNADPKLELATSFSNEYIPFEGVEVSYNSTDELVSFANEDDKIVMHIAPGTAPLKITMTATYKGKTATLDVNIDAKVIELPETISVKDSLECEDGEILTLRGIVMSSLIVQKGFYLNDGTGVIAIRTTSETLNLIDLGNEVVVRGTRKHVTSNTNIGQLCIDDATLVANLMGNYEFDRSTFITDMTFEEIFEYKFQQKTLDITTNVYVANCYIKKSVGTYSTNYYIGTKDQTKQFLLYSSSGSQYAIYDPFTDGREITLTFALCDWNSKSEFRACIITATDGETEILNNYNFK